MKRLLFVLVALLLVSAVMYSQQIPTATQGVRANMRLGPHDFSADSGAVKGASNSICAYCHSMKVPAAEAMNNMPQWNRKNNVGGTYGVYSSPTLTAAIADVKSDENYSLLCMSCHDGSALFAINSYTTGKRPRTTTGFTWDTTLTVPTEVSFGPGGEFSLSHTHPVNFTYDNALAAADGGLFNPVSSSLAFDGGTGAKFRLFGGKMQCSTCHNVHMKSGIGTYASSTGGKLCISCHNK